MEQKTLNLLQYLLAYNTWQYSSTVEENKSLSRIEHEYAGQL